MEQEQPVKNLFLSINPGLTHHPEITSDKEPIRIKRLPFSILRLQGETHRSTFVKHEENHKLNVVVFS
jgi:hypothetical protein